MNWSRNFRRLLACGAVVILVLAVGSGVRTYRHERASRDESRDYNGITQVAIDIKVEQSRGLFQVALLVLAFLWGFVFAKRDERQITAKDGLEIVMLVSASVLLIGSLKWHWMYLDRISDAYKVAGATLLPKEIPDTIPDVFAARTTHLFDYQFWFFVLGIVVAGFTLFSTFFLKGSEHGAQANGVGTALSRPHQQRLPGTSTPGTEKSTRDRNSERSNRNSEEPR